MLDRAIEIASTALDGMKDPDGNSYLDHALRVMEKMDTEDEKIVAVLHDVIEDTELTLGELAEEGFSRRVLDSIEQLTKRRDVTYYDYIDDISGTELASKVKIAEIEDNKDIARVRKMSFQTYSIDERARRSLKILRGE